MKKEMGVGSRKSYGILIVRALETESTLSHSTGQIDCDLTERKEWWDSTDLCRDNRISEAFLVLAKIKGVCFSTYTYLNIYIIHFIRIEYV